MSSELSEAAAAGLSTFPRPLSIEDGTYEAIRSMILDGRIAPGSSLALEQLAAELEVSTMPVRGALGRLTSEGLVRKLRSRGSIVAPLELEDFEEIQAVRSGVEAFAARLGAERVGDQELEAMGVFFERLHEAALVDDLLAYLVAEWDFHALCYRASGRSRLVSLVADYRRRAERYVRLVVASSPHFAQAIRIQELFLEAATARDGARAERVVRDAIDWSVSQVSEILSG